MSEKNSPSSIAAVLERIGSSIGATKDIDIANALGVSRQTVSGWKRRESIPYETLLPFAKEHHLSLNYLLWGDGEGLMGASDEEEVTAQPVSADLMRYLFEGMDDELFLHERIANEPLGFDLLCRAYNSAIKNAQGADLDLSNPKVKAAADAAMKDVIDFYHEMFRFISGSMAERKEPGKAGNSSVNQTFHGSVGQAGGGDIHNYGDKDK